MEELQSTEILDREILEDARKKAHRILKTAEDTIKAKTTEWDKNLSAALGELEKKHAQQGKSALDEAMVRLPIDKRRVKAGKIEELLRDAVEIWYSGLSRERILALLKKELLKRIADSVPTAENGMRVRIHKIDKTEAEALMQSVSGASCAIEEFHSLSAYPEIVVETPEARIYASIGKTVDFYLSDKRAELAEALLGHPALLDEPVMEETL
ncbi:MAG: ATPase [Treponema sp.]|nr:ATPase [Treponema sp.]